MTKYNSLESKFRSEESQPSSPKVGDVYFDTENNRLMRFNGAYFSGIVFGTTTSTSTSTSTTTSTSTSTTSTSSSTTTTMSTTTSTSTTTTL